MVCWFAVFGFVGGCCDYLVTGWFFSALFLLGCVLVVRREFVLVVAWVVGIRLVGGHCVFRGCCGCVVIYSIAIVGWCY